MKFFVLKRVWWGLWGHREMPRAFSRPSVSGAGHTPRRFFGSLLGLAPKKPRRSRIGRRLHACVAPHPPPCCRKNRTKPGRVEARRGGFEGSVGEQTATAVCCCSSCLEEVRPPRVRRHSPHASLSPNATTSRARLASTSGATSAIRRAPFRHHLRDRRFILGVVVGRSGHFLRARSARAHEKKKVMRGWWLAGDLLSVRIEMVKRGLARGALWAGPKTGVQVFVLPRRRRQERRFAASPGGQKRRRLLGHLSLRPPLTAHSETTFTSLASPSTTTSYSLACINISPPAGKTESRASPVF